MIPYFSMTFPTRGDFLKATNICSDPKNEFRSLGASSEREPAVRLRGAPKAGRMRGLTSSYRVQLRLDFEPTGTFVQSLVQVRLSAPTRPSRGSARCGSFGRVRQAARQRAAGEWRVARYHNIFGPEGAWTGGPEKWGRSTSPDLSPLLDQLRAHPENIIPQPMQHPCALIFRRFLVYQPQE
jgi:hypothetical protein